MNTQSPVKLIGANVYALHSIGQYLLYKVRMVLDIDSSGFLELLGARSGREGSGHCWVMGTAALYPLTIGLEVPKIGKVKHV